MADRDYTIVGPDGREVTIVGPDTATPDQLKAAAKRAFAMMPAEQPQEPEQPQTRNPLDSIASPGVRALAAGLGKGASNVGLGAQELLGKGIQWAGSGGARGGNLSSLITGQQPRNLVQSAGDWLVQNAQTGRKNTAEEFAPIKAEHPMAAGGGEIGGEVLSTLPVGAVLAKPVAWAAGKIGIPVLQQLAQALATSGMKTGANPIGFLPKAGDLALRSVGGAATGGLSAELANPGDGGTGAMIGGAMPGSLALLGGAGRFVGQAVKSSTQRGGEELARLLELMNPADRANAISQLRQAAPLLHGSDPTVAQTLMTPAASTLERVVSAHPGGVELQNRMVAQGEARTNALGGVAAINAGGARDAKQDFGEMVGRYVFPEERRIRDQFGPLYKAVDAGKRTAIEAPIDAMGQTIESRLANIAGQGGSAREQLANVTRAGTTEGPTVTKYMKSTEGAAKWRPEEVLGPTIPKKLDWETMQDLRSSIDAAWRGVKADPSKKREAAALVGMRNDLDNAVNAASEGRGKPGDLMPQDVVDRWREVNRDWAAFKQRFHTGPQARMFREVDGQPARQGGEIATAFWGNRPGLKDDVASFQRLVDGDQGLMDQFRSMVVSEGAGKASATGNLGHKFAEWVEQTRPGLRQAFDAEDFQMLNRIALDIRRAAKAAGMGATIGGNSSTAQNALHALDGGLLGSEGAKTIARAVRMKGFAPLEWARAGIVDSADKSQARMLGGLLTNPLQAANALDRVGHKNALLRLLGGVDNQQLGYRIAPLLGGD